MAATWEVAPLMGARNLLVLKSANCIARDNARASHSFRSHVHKVQLD
jgi:hypothetical protein